MSRRNSARIRHYRRQCFQLARNCLHTARRKPASERAPYVRMALHFRAMAHGVRTYFGGSR